MATLGDKRHIKKISVEQLQTGMYIHDINCGWMDHPFVANHFVVKDKGIIAKIIRLGIHEVYIDILRGYDVQTDAPTVDEVRHEIEEQFFSIAEEPQKPIRVPLQVEKVQAERLHAEANQIVRGLICDIRLGKQIEMEKVEPMVEKMVDSIFRNPDALLPLGRLKDHDDYTFQHSVSVCALMIAFARGMDLDHSTIRELASGALLHDVGKAKVPDGILNKPAKLTDAEFAKMKSHVVQSMLILQNTPGVSDIALAVAGQHHERFDGSGYPNKLKGEGISLYGRMGAIVDVYDAITSDRVYHKGIPPTEALGKLLEWSKFYFDPILVRKFVKTLGIYPTGSLVRLESGRLGVVLEQHPEQLMLPLVKVFFDSVSRLYFEPEIIDLARSGSGDKVIGHESFETWGIDMKKWVAG